MRHCWTYCQGSSVLAEEMSTVDTGKSADTYITIDIRPLKQIIYHFGDCVATVLAMERVEREKSRFQNKTLHIWLCGSNPMHCDANERLSSFVRPYVSGEGQSACSILFR